MSNKTYRVGGLKCVQLQVKEQSLVHSMLVCHGSLF